jgi:ACS family hexuronate transporter-like MFS transporter
MNEQLANRTKPGSAIDERAAAAIDDGSGAVYPHESATVGYYRWTICALLFFATTINYLDRQVLAVLAPLLQKQIGWDEAQYGYIVTAFQGAYAIGLLLAGSFMDRVGTRIGYAAALGVWSLATMGHALVRSVMGFGVARLALGFGESGNFPAAVKTVAEWFPRKERALATGLFNSGTNVGAIVAPLAVPWIAVRLGWQWAFICTGALGATWLVAWLLIYRRPQDHSKISSAELAYINSDPPEHSAKIPWSNLLQHRQTWAILVAKLLTDPTWWFLLFWLPKFLNTKHGLTITEFGLPLVIIYNAATLGSVVGGWLPKKFLGFGWPLNRARKATMLLCATAALPIVFAAVIHNLWGAVAVISLAAAAHQGWSANVYTLVSDVFPRGAVGSVVGIAGFGGAIGGMFAATLTGLVLQMNHGYTPVFVIAGCTYMVALVLLQLIVPKIKSVDFSRDLADI